MNYDDKEKMVKDVFHKVAENYDVMNDFMSLGVHRLWKSHFVDAIGPMRKRRIMDEQGNVIGEEPIKVLDVAGGTGDIAFKIYEKANM